MKSVSIIKKNFKLLIRSKASAFTVLIGPLLIILLVGLAFSGKGSYELSLGYYTPTPNDLTQSFIESLEQSNYFIQEFDDEQSCVRKIEQGVIHTCIIFPDNFEISNEQKNELRFLVDYSRMNLVYKVIDSVSEILDIESKELSYSLTQILLSRINTTLSDLDDDLVVLGKVNSNINLLTMDIQRARINTESMKLEIGEITASDIKSNVLDLNETISAIQEKGIELINQSEDLVEMLDDYLSHNDTKELEEEVEILKNETFELYNATPEEVQLVLDSIDEMSDSLSELETDLNTSKRLNKETQQKLDSAKNTIASIQGDLNDLKSALEKTRNNLKSIGVTSAETIVSPVNTKIEPVVSENSKLTFIFPFLLVLVIMFVALLLSSTLIMFEKNSKAFFRNFITPTKRILFVYATFITSIIVILVQTIIILGLANYFLHIPLFKNALLTIIIILVTTTFFIVLGMAIGYLFSTQEGAIMVSIVLASVFLFLSNLVVPLESLAPLFAGIINYNPFVMASELLRKSLLFTVGIGEVVITLLILFGASVIIFALIAVFQGLIGNKKINAPADVLEDELAKKKPDHSSPSSTPTSSSSSKPEVKKGDGKSELSAKMNLYKKVSDMTRAEFEENVSLRENKIADMVEKRFDDKKLASKLRKTTSRNMILKILEEELKREKKKVN